ncbi:hypothetical protein D3C76_1490000 [compost metagenome]
MAVFSSSFSHLACSGRSVSQNQPNRPSATAGRPVTTNSICQSFMPSTPCRWVMMVPASGPVTIPATVPDIRNTAVIRPRSSEGNQ